MRRASPADATAPIQPIPSPTPSAAIPSDGNDMAMIKQLIHFSIRNRLFVLAAAFALTLYGLY